MVSNSKEDPTPMVRGPGHDYRDLARLESGAVHGPSVSRMFAVANVLPNIMQPEQIPITENFVANAVERLGMRGTDFEEFHDKVCGGNTDLAAALVLANRHGLKKIDAAAWLAGARGGIIPTRRMRETLRGITPYIVSDIWSTLDQFVGSLKDVAPAPSTPAVKSMLPPSAPELK